MITSLYLSVGGYFVARSNPPSFILPVGGDDITQQNQMQNKVVSTLSLIILKRTVLDLSPITWSSIMLLNVW